MILGNYLCDFFPFLRRYQPGFAFPLFFVFCVFVWRTLNASEFRRALVYAAVSGIAFVILVFSYFYLWTAALAWLGCFTAFWIIGRREERYKTLAKAGFIGLFVLAAVIPYFLLLAGRVQNLDDVQLLSYTRLPNLFALPELIGFVVAGAIFYFVRNGKLNFRSPEVLFVFSIALTPFVLFNQQVVTGRSLQPVHYEIFIANYLVLADIILAAWIITRSFNSDRMRLLVRRGLVYLGIVAAIWGLIESTATARRNAGYESLRDDAMPALSYLKEQEDANDQNRHPVVFTTSLMVADFVPTVTSYRPLWNPHTNSAGGVDQAEYKQLFYRYLYYSGFGERDVAKAMQENLFEVMAAFFGGGRALPTLSYSEKAVTRAEMETGIKEYMQFCEKFDSKAAAEPALSFVMVPTLAEPNF